MLVLFSPHTTKGKGSKTIDAPKPKKLEKKHHQKTLSSFGTFPINKNEKNGGRREEDRRGKTRTKTKKKKKLLNSFFLSFFRREERERMKKEQQQQQHKALIKSIQNDSTLYSALYD